jgi:glycosyltransferase involved in cell wall biosynthesis
VLFLCAFWPGNAGYEYRSARWARVLEEEGFEVDVDCVFTHPQFWSWAEANDPRLYLVPARHRLRRILDSAGYGTVIVRREVLLWNDYGNLFLERLLLAMHPGAILDVDDDLGAAKGEPRARGWFGRLLQESSTPFATALSLYRRVIVGSSYLEELVRRRAPQLGRDDIVVVPTCLDYENEQPRAYVQRSDQLVFGWIGGTGNLHELDLVAPALERIARDVPLRLLVISGKDYSHGALEVENVRWDMATHLDELRRVDIGLMPLQDTPANRGKCGMKLLQYMGLGIVSVATDLTVNGEIVDDGVNGFLVAPGADWEPVLRRVIATEPSFAQIGAAARERVLARYSFEANRETFVGFVTAAARTRADR